ncbi:sigma 54-interacting transcriptional regulator [Tundrisphaera lichenicola]|uniref:sigma 54-interacting transcriptional regulator n=1 Tax=Tundrisphaera lichenicola TaxID=2029860 RepID=UPI003EBC7855
MFESTMMLISDDAIFLEAARTAGRSIEQVEIAVLPNIDRAYSYRGWDRVGSVIIHRRRNGPSPDVHRLLRMIAAARHPIAAMIVAEKPDAEESRALTGLGAVDYIERPDTPGQWNSRLRELVARTRRSRRIESRRESTGQAFDLFPSDFDDDCPEMARLMSQVRRVAPLDAPILLDGEVGTGKSRLARLIHELSDRRKDPFVVLNCGAYSADRIEEELFGQDRTERGGIGGDVSGKIAEAGWGTLLLDEIENLPTKAQLRLLRAIEAQSSCGIGRTGSPPIRARLIAVSNRPIDGEVAAGRFRADLYFRLNVVGFRLPPLRDRCESIPVLVEQFISEFSSHEDPAVDSISEDALRVLGAHAWPGNIRELRDVIEQAMQICPGHQIQPRDLPESLRPGSWWTSGPAIAPRASDVSILLDQATLDQTKREAERARIAEALHKHGNNRLRTASELGISRMTLYKKLYKYGLMNQIVRRGGVA